MKNSIEKSIYKTRKTLALLIFGLAIFLITPPGIPLFGLDDLLNLEIARWLAPIVSLPFFTMLVLTYTLIPILLFILSAYTFPGDSGRFFRSHLNKGKVFIVQKFKEYKKKPYILIIGLIIFTLLLKFYINYIQKTIS